MALTTVELWQRIEELEMVLTDLLVACEQYHDYDKCSGAGCDMCAAEDNAEDCLEAIEEAKRQEGNADERCVELVTESGNVGVAHVSADVEQETIDALKQLIDAAHKAVENDAIVSRTSPGTCKLFGITPDCPTHGDDFEDEGAEYDWARRHL